MLHDSLMQKVEALIRDAADEFILPRFRSLPEDAIRAKSHPNDLVTIADEETEIALRPQLESLVPGSVVIGEEAVADNPNVLHRLNADGDFWVVDPVDGTWNFVHGNEGFASMVAFIRKGRIIGSWILAVTEGSMAMAERGAGAEWGGASAQGLAPRVPIAEAVIDIPGPFSGSPFADGVAAGLSAAGSSVDSRCAGWAYIRLITGETQAYLPGKMMPWDHAPGVLLIEEAGGRSAFLPDAAPYRPLPQDPCPLLSTGNASMWNALQDAFTV